MAALFATGSRDLRRDRATHSYDGGVAPPCRGFRRAALPPLLLAILGLHPAEGPVCNHAARAARFAGSQPVFNAFRDIPVVSISDAQRLALPQARFVATVPHGVPDRRLASQPQITPTDPAFLGRIAPEKGPDRAIRIARACGIPLRIAAKVDKADQHYFDEIIRPMLDWPGVEMIGEIIRYGRYQSQEMRRNDLIRVDVIADDEY